jgi:hypothetical protein
MPEKAYRYTQMPRSGDLPRLAVWPARMLSARVPRPVVAAAFLFGTVAVAPSASAQVANGPVVETFIVGAAPAFDTGINVATGGTLTLDVGPKPGACIDFDAAPRIRTGPSAVDVSDLGFFAAGTVETITIPVNGPLIVGSTAGAPDPPDECFAALVEVTLTYTAPGDGGEPPGPGAAEPATAPASA